MTKEVLLRATIEKLTKLPRERLKEVADFAEFVLKKYEEEVLSKGMEKLIGKTKTYDFLRDEKVEYTVEDLKEKY